MNRKEVLEIKKLFTDSKCCISRICGCYVDGNKNKVTTFKEAFLSLDQEEIFKYYKIFRSALSGTFGKNLLNMEFPTDAETEEGTQSFLLKLRDSELKDDDMLELFFNKIIENYSYGENYLILLIHGAYDVPGKADDGMNMEDASDYVYNHIFCCICPVNLSEEGLCYNTETNSFENRIRSWIVEKPAHAFLFPAFNDRNSDIHNLLYYSKKPEELNDSFIDGMLGVRIPMTCKVQKETFAGIIADTLGDECSFNTIKTLHEELNSMVEAKAEQDPNPVEIDKFDMQKALEKSGVKDETINSFKEEFDESAGTNACFTAANIVNTKTFDVRTPDVVVKISGDRTELVETREIDGVKYLMIELTDNIEVNGIKVTNY